jgi:hypothetical protein
LSYSYTYAHDQKPKIRPESTAMPPVHTNHNPYEGWSKTNSGHSNYSSGSASGGPPPSIFGALPYPTPPNTRFAPNLTTLYLTSLSPSVLNCAVIGPHSRLHYSISTDSNMPGYTVVKNADRKSVALIEWTKQPRVEIRGAVPKQETKGWLKISRDQTCVGFSVPVSCHSIFNSLLFVYAGTGP